MLSQYLAKSKDKIHDVYNEYSSKSVSYKIGIILFGISAGFVCRNLYDRIIRKIFNYPPGPSGVPFFGSLFKFYQYQYIKSLTNSFGSVVMVNLGLNRAIFIDDYDIIKNIFNRPEFTYRDHQLSSNPNSISQINGKQYDLRRKLIHSSFNELNANFLSKYGIDILSNHLFKKIEIYIKEKQAVNILNDLKYSIHSLLFITLFGNMPFEDDEYQKFQNFSEKALSDVAVVFIYHFFLGPSKISKWFIRNTVTKSRSKYFNEAENIIKIWIQKFENKDYQNNLSKLAEDNKILYHEPCALRLIQKLSKDEVAMDIFAIFIAGQGNAMIRISNACVLLAKYQKIQQLIFNEVYESKLKFGQFNLKNTDSMHILKAFVSECIRYEDFGTTPGIPKVVIDSNAKINGYNVPKHCMIFGLYASFNHDEKYWKNPFEFDINNFLTDDDDDGSKRFKKNNYFCGFGIGRRSCMGMSFAKRIMYLIIASMLLKYKFVESNDEEFKLKLPKWNGSGQLRNYLKKSKILIQHRNC